MLKIGEFSKLSHLTVKALRFYEREGLLIPASIDSWTGYRYYETSQLEQATRIKAYRQLDLSIDEIKCILHGEDVKAILEKKISRIEEEKKQLDTRLSIIQHILQNDKMKYQVITKEIEPTIVYYAEVVVDRYSDMMSLIPTFGQECLNLNPKMKCTEPEYCFCEYLDDEHREENISVRYNEAVVEMGKESELIRFRKVPAVKVLSIFHKGHYDSIGEAYAYLFKFAEENHYEIADRPREVYIDGIWNKESEEDWLTEIQLPIK